MRRPPPALLAVVCACAHHAAPARSPSPSAAPEVDIAAARARGAVQAFRWGFRNKAPIGDNVMFELRRAAHGDER